MLDPDIGAHYELGLEGSRLFIDGRPRLEYLRALELLERLLPAPPSRVLDVGGGTGLYAIPLTGEGHEVRVVDARALPADDHSYDVVLLLGPLYHLTERENRPVRDRDRSCRPGGTDRQSPPHGAACWSAGPGIAGCTTTRSRSTRLRSQR